MPTVIAVWRFSMRQPCRKFWFWKISYVELKDSPLETAPEFHGATPKAKMCMALEICVFSPPMSYIRLQKNNVVQMPEIVTGCKSSGTPE